MKRYLVTGGTGFLGRSLVRALVERGEYVSVLDNESRGHHELLKGLEYEFIHGDIRNEQTVLRATRGIDVVCHLAYINGTNTFYTHPDTILDVAVRGISNVIHAAMTHNVAELSVASSSEVYQSAPEIPTDETVPLSVPDPLNPRYSYGGGKIIAELMALNFAKFFQKVTVFRPHNVYGPDAGEAHVIPQLVKRIDELRTEGKTVYLPIQGTGQETRSFVHIDDFTQGLLTVMDHGQTRNIYNIGNPEEVTIEALAKLIGRAFGKDIEILPGPLQPGGCLRRCPNIDKLKKLGYSPKISLAEGIEKVVHAYLGEQVCA